MFISCNIIAHVVNIAGDESLHGELRQRTAMELVENAESLACHPHLSGAANVMGCSIETLLQTIAPESERATVPDWFRAEGVRTAADKKWGSILQLVALANVVKRPILTELPAVELYARPLLCGSIEPLEFGPARPNLTPSTSHPIAVFWSRCGGLDNRARTYVPDHVVPIVIRCGKYI